EAGNRGGPRRVRHKAQASKEGDGDRELGERHRGRRLIVTATPSRLGGRPPADGAGARPHSYEALSVSSPLSQVPLVSLGCPQTPTERNQMTDKLKNTALIVVPIAALALGGAAIAGAASGSGSNA